MKKFDSSSILSIGTHDRDFFICPERYDLMAKCLYVRFYKDRIDSSYGREIYLEHLRILNGLVEKDGSGKAGKRDFIESFNRILDSVAIGGLDPDISLVPVSQRGVLGDGAHRVAAAITYNKSVESVVFKDIGHSFDFAYFNRKGLAQRYLDAMACEMVTLSTNFYFLVLFPSAEGRDGEVEDLISKAGPLFYKKDVTLNDRGAFNFVRQIYSGQSWVGDWSDDFKGARKKARNCFLGESQLRCFIFQADKLADVRLLKSEIRSLYNVRNHSVHVSDTSAETLDMARLLCNENSIHHLNTSELKYFERFTPLFEKYRHWLLRKGFDPENFCIDGSAILASYGLRDARDLDFLHFGEDALDTGMHRIDSHNDQMLHHAFTRDDIIFNPDNHFWYYGMKFASLNVIRAMKTARNEFKDSADVELIDGLAPAELGPRLNRFERMRRSVQIWLKEAKRKRKERKRPDAILPPKIVGLLPARNESAKIEFCIRSLSMYTDAIVFLDDCSDDDTVNVVESLADECSVERIICKSSWYRDEPGDRNTLLTAGRQIGGTHFVVIDADEAFTANCNDSDYLRKWIRSLRPTEQLSLQWIQLWRSVDRYRDDESVWGMRFKRCIFCDDGKASYKSKFIHTSRIPKMKGRKFTLKDANVGLLHFQFVNWDNLVLKQKWYRWLERVRDPNKSISEINQKYKNSIDEEGLGLSESPQEWFEQYHFMDPSIFKDRDEWRDKQMSEWSEQYGASFFDGLD